MTSGGYTNTFYIFHLLVLKNWIDTHPLQGSLDFQIIRFSYQYKY